MRNLKKVLSLSLALVMLLGMMIVGAGAATYADVPAGAENEDAIEVMSAIEVLTGTGDGFMPEATLDRAQAATIIARMLYTKAVADKLNGAESTFSDVMEQAPWAAGAIQACVLEGIVSGDGAGHYNPTGKVTGYQFGKMLLVAIGYADKTRYEGASWEFNVRQDLIKAKLDQNVSIAVISNQPLKRGDAAQLAFNALNWTDSGNKTGKWVVENISGNNDGADDETKWPNLGDTEFDSYLEALMTVNALELVGSKINTDYRIVEKEDNTGSLADVVFDLTSSRVGVETVFGAPATDWLQDNVVIATVADKPIREYTTGVSVSKIYVDLGRPKNANIVNVVTDGLSAAGEALTGTSRTTYGGNGTLTQVYRVSGGYKVVVINTYVGWISKYTPAKLNAAGDVTTPESVTVTEMSVSNHSVSAANRVFATDKFSSANQGNTVLYTVAYVDTNEDDIRDAYTVQSVDVADSITAVPTYEQTTNGGSGVKSFIAGGTTYYYSEKNNATWITNTEIRGKTDVTLYFDKCGYVIATSTPQQIPNLGVVVAADQVRGSNEGVFGNTYQLKLVKTDGTTAVVKTDKASYEAFCASNATDAKVFDHEIAKSKIVIYYENANGSISLDYTGRAYPYTLTTGTALGSSITQITPKQSTLGTGAQRVYTNDATVFVHKTAFGYNVYTGISNVPNITNNNVALTGSAYDFYGNGYADVVFVGNGQADNASTNDLVFVAADSALYIADGSKYGVSYYYSYNAVINGQITTLDANDLITVDTLYTAMRVNARGLYMLDESDKATTNAVNGDSNAFGISNPAANAIMLDTANTKNSYYYNADTQAFSVKNGEIEAITIERGIADSAAKLVFAYNQAINGNVLTCLYVIDEGMVAPTAEEIAAEATANGGTYAAPDGSVINGETLPSSVEKVVAETGKSVTIVGETDTPIEAEAGSTVTVDTVKGDLTAEAGSTVTIGNIAAGSSVTVTPGVDLTITGEQEEVIVVAKGDDDITDDDLKALPDGVYAVAADEQDIGATIGGWADDTVAIRFATTTANQVVNITLTQTVAGVEKKYEGKFTFENAGPHIVYVSLSAPYSDYDFAEGGSKEGVTGDDKTALLAIDFTASTEPVSVVAKTGSNTLYAGTVSPELAAIENPPAGE